MIKAPISGYWAVTANERLDNVDSRYFAWLAAKYVARGISTLFLMGLFLKVDARSLPQKNRDVRINQFLVPATMLVILGAFLESLIDEHVGLLDSRLRFVSNVVMLCFSLIFICLLFYVCLLFLAFVRSFLEGGIGWLYFDPPVMKSSLFTTFTFSSFSFGTQFLKLSVKQRDKTHKTWHATYRSTVTRVV